MARQIIAFAEQDFQPAPCGIPRNCGSINTAANNQKVICHGALLAVIILNRYK
jgi:hypothetical protein